MNLGLTEGESNMLHRLPPEVLLEIYKNLELVDITKVQAVNCELYNKTRGVAPYIVTQHLKRYHITKSAYYGALSYTLNNFFQVAAKTFSTYNPWRTSVGFEDVQKFVFENMKNIVISTTAGVNELFIKIIMFSFSLDFDEVDTTYLYHYPNQLELLALYLLLQIDHYKDVSMPHVPHYVTFLSSLAFTKYADVFRRYGREVCIIYETNQNYFLPLETLYMMASAASTVNILRKLVGYKPLSLENTIMFPSCEFSIEDGMQYLTSLRFNLPHDDLVGHNYNQIRRLFKHYPGLKGVMNAKEIECVNAFITVLNPYNNTKVAITSRKYKSLLQKLKSDLPALYEQRSYIICRQKRLQRKYFQ